MLRLAGGDIRDVAQAAVLAEQHGRSGERYIIAGEFIRNRDFYRLATDAGRVPPIKMIPLWLAYAIAWPVEHVFKLLRRTAYVVGPDPVFLSALFREMENGKKEKAPV